MAGWIAFYEADSAYSLKLMKRIIIRVKKDKIEKNKESYIICVY